MLVVAANMPFGGVGYSRHTCAAGESRGPLCAKDVGDPAGVVTNLKITSLPLDDIVATVLT